MSAQNDSPHFRRYLYPIFLSDTGNIDLRAPPFRGGGNARAIFRKGVTFIGRKWLKQALTALVLVFLLSAVEVVPAASAAYFPREAVSAAETETRYLVPVGRAVGMKIVSDGILVVGMTDVPCAGGTVSPARSAGLKEGDLIISVGSRKVGSTQELKEALADGGEVKITYERDGSEHLAVLKPALSDEDGTYKLGAWVRDSMAGIGTLTFYDPSSGVFGALGHGINDVTTSELMPVASGTLIRSTISSVRKGESGAPGELSGSFDLSDEFGELYSNTDCGIFGSADAEALGVDVSSALPAARADEVQEGPATILSNVSGDTVDEYAIKIKRVSRTGENSPRDLLIEVTDKELIAATGGIVQGMSGSPIIQNGKLVGAVTHVLVSDPTRGYGILIENMLDAE